MTHKHSVAIFGAAVAGSEAAATLASHDVEVFVFEQNALPYGKIEYGLPMWHIKLRDKYEKIIDEKLDHPGVRFMPLVKLGRDLSFSDVVEKWPFQVVLLATGAWRDRPLPVPGVDDYIGRGFYYQNPLVSWFNQKHDPAYQGPGFDLKEGAIIIGGGLASIDVAKIVMLETFMARAREMGREIDLFTLERLGLPAAAEQLELDLKQMNLKPCTIYYRRRRIDMPLSSNPEVESEEAWAKVHNVREKILTRAQGKYLFKVEELHSPVKTIVERDRLAGLVFRKNEIRDGRLQAVADSDYEVQAPLVISSIGSIPEPIEGVPWEGEKMALADVNTGRVKGWDHVYVLGNALTGKGNIKESLHHGRKISENIAREYLGLQETADEAYEIKLPIADQIDNLKKEIESRPPLSKEEYDYLCQCVGDACHCMVGEGEIPGCTCTHYKDWIETHMPLRLENMIRDKQNEQK